MKNLLEYLNLCLEFINEKSNEVIVDRFVNNIQDTVRTMSIEQIEGFEMAFESLFLFYQKQVSSIDEFRDSLMNNYIGEDIKSSFDDKLNELEKYAQKLECIVHFMNRVSDTLELRKREILGLEDDTIKLN
ncbi:MAG: hypothetical protein J5982_01110 [Bacilli bacterium]|nr:hypothetical protein [Bacilli bacterium]